MRETTDPQKIQEGMFYLSLLKERRCPNFRCHVGNIREAVRKGLYTYEDLGTTEVEVLELGVHHAGTATIEVSRYPLVDLAVKHALLCDLQKAQGAHQKPAYADNVIPLEEKRALAA